MLQIVLYELCWLGSLGGFSFLVSFKQGCCDVGDFFEFVYRESCLDDIKIFFDSFQVFFIFRVDQVLRYFFGLVRFKDVVRVVVMEDFLSFLGFGVQLYIIFCDFFSSFLRLVGQSKVRFGLFFISSVCGVLVYLFFVFFVLAFGNVIINNCYFLGDIVKIFFY